MNFLIVGKKLRIRVVTDKDKKIIWTNSDTLELNPWIGYQFDELVANCCEFMPIEVVNLDEKWMKRRKLK